MSHKQKKHISDLYDLATLDDEKPGLYNSQVLENILNELEKAQRVAKAFYYS